MCFILFKEGFNGPVLVRFLRRRLRQRKRKVFMIMDRQPVHCAALVKRRLGRHGGRLRLFLLPGYSSELKPDEYLNQDVKTSALARQRPPDQPTMMRNVRSYLCITQTEPGEFFVNPGAESDELVAQARKLGLDPILACSIVDIGLSPGEFPD